MTTIFPYNFSAHTLTTHIHDDISAYILTTYFHDDISAYILTTYFHDDISAHTLTTCLHDEFSAHTLTTPSFHVGTFSNTTGDVSSDPCQNWTVFIVQRRFGVPKILTSVNRLKKDERFRTSSLLRSTVRKLPIQRPVVLKRCQPRSNTAPG